MAPDPFLRSPTNSKFTDDIKSLMKISEAFEGENSSLRKTFDAAVSKQEPTFIQSQQEEIRGALARGYCSKENEHKVLDPELIQAMAKEVDSLISQVVQNTVEALRTQMLGDAFFKQCDGCSCDAKEVIKQHCALFLKDITKEEITSDNLK